MMIMMTGCAVAQPTPHSRGQTDVGQLKTGIRQMDSDADVVSILKVISAAQSISVVPLEGLASTRDMKVEDLFEAGMATSKSTQVASALADQIRQLSIRSLSDLPPPPPFPFHLDAIVRFDAADATVVLTVCRICRYGYFYIRTAAGIVASRRISLDELDAALDAASPDYRKAPHN
jgi:hypothetical protein